MPSLNAIELSLFANRVAAICDEMGAVLRRSAFSPNIRDRLDYSCAIFDADGQLVEQAAAIPVHLGSMAFAMQHVVKAVDWRPGCQLILNDPFRGGTHLPDVTLVGPIWFQGERVGFAANRAHHADIGCDSPGAMPLSRHIDEEGLLIPPTLLDLEQSDALDGILAAMVRPEVSRGDLWAQISANQAGARRITDLIESAGLDGWQARTRALNDYGERLARSMVASIPNGVYQFEDSLDGDPGQPEIPLRVSVEVLDEAVRVDFSGTAGRVNGNLNCPLSVTAAGVHYVFRCLMPEHAPRCAGAMRPVQLFADAGGLLNASYPAAVAAGNVETSTRVVDLVCGALAKALPNHIPAAAQGSMNNLAMGYRGTEGPWWDYYETLAGGAGGHPLHPGGSGVHTHMTNTLNTPVEVLEHSYPLRIERYAVRRHSGGSGASCGGDGLIREYRFMGPAQVTLMTERRKTSPWGLAGGEAGSKGENRLNGSALGGRCGFQVNAGDRLTIFTPGGGGWGRAE